MKITISNLSMTFDKDIHALNNVNLTIEDGLFVLLGPNGCGKSTLIRILATILNPTSGTISFNGSDLTKNRDKIRSITGYLPQRFNEFRPMTVFEFLDYSARLCGLRDKKARNAEINELMSALGLTAVKDRNANDISPVHQRHLEIAQAVIGNPRIILMDEPTVGLSPEERLRFVELLFEWTKKAENIIFSTHILTDITSTCKSVALLDKGSVAYQGSPDGLTETVKGREWQLRDPEKKKT
jgi:ABC-2 type transport system ATP-binding protein